MCSIEGFTGSQPFTIEDYTRFNKDRGPDATNYWQDDRVSLGHNLLAIAPQPPGKSQPFVTDKGNVLCYNGEIFGLESEIFDTEWLANKIENDGIQSLKHGINGMWAFSWYDVKKQRITLARDHFGVKPLYYVKMDGNLFWSSTPKPLYALLNMHGGLRIDRQKLDIMQKASRFMPMNLVPYENINKLAPGEIMTWDLRENSFHSFDTMWHSDPAVWNLDMNLKWDPEELSDIIQKAFQDVHRPGPTVKKTVSLSGGLDSTLITSVLRPYQDLSATSCSWEYQGNNDDGSIENLPMYDESILAQRTCEQWDVKFYKSKVPFDFNPLMKEAYQALGIPIWDRNRVIPRYVNVKHAAENGHKVYLVGDTADEILTGYNGDFNNFYPSHARCRTFGVHNIPDGCRRWIPGHLFGNDHINNACLFRTLMEGESFCLVADHLAGSFGMESRVPFLHQDLAKYLLKIPGAYKLHVPFKHKSFAKDYKKRKEQRFWRMGNWKAILRDHMTRYYPSHVLNRQKKIGFANPWDARNDKKNKHYAEADTKLLNILMKKLTFNVE